MPSRSHPGATVINCHFNCLRIVTIDHTCMVVCLRLYTLAYKPGIAGLRPCAGRGTRSSMSADPQKPGPVPLQPAPQPTGKNAAPICQALEQISPRRLSNADANIPSSLVNSDREFPLDVCQARDLEIENDELAFDKRGHENSVVACQALEQKSRTCLTSANAKIPSTFDKGTGSNIENALERLLASLDRICPACMASNSQATWDLLHGVRT